MALPLALPGLLAFLAFLAFHASQQVLLDVWRNIVTFGMVTVGTQLAGTVEGGGIVLDAEAEISCRLYHRNSWTVTCNGHYFA